MRPAAVAIVGVGVYIPGIRSLDHFLAVAAGQAPHAAVNEDPALPWKGMRYKDRATRMGLAAAKDALERARLPFLAAEQTAGETCGVIVSSNLGNVDTVCRVLSTIRAGGSGAASAMDLPNCSSNVIASSIAICAGLKGVNLMLCNGATSGTDALYTAATAIRAGRATRMVVVGVEARTVEAARLLAETGGAAAPPLALGEGAAALVLEDPEAAAARGVEPLGYVGRYSFVPGQPAPGPLPPMDGITPDLWLTPNGHADRPDAPGRRLDLSRAFGNLYGATGVMHAAAAALWLATQPRGTALGTTGECDGAATASILIHREHPYGARAC